jgi:hypothetical protein
MRQQRDAMIFRFKPDPNLAVELDNDTVESKPVQVTKVVSEFEFINEFKRPPGHPFWSTIDHMQTTLKIISLSGLGRQFQFTFNAPCFKSYPTKSRLPPKNIHPLA